MKRKIITRYEARVFLENLLLTSKKELTEEDKLKIKEIAICLQFECFSAHVWGCDSDEFTKLYVAVESACFDDEIIKLLGKYKFSPSEGEKQIKKEEDEARNKQKEKEYAKITKKRKKEAQNELDKFLG